jgi:hypothetical protein
MDVKELLNTLEQRKKGLAYELWKQACLNQYILSKDFPKTPEDASPELYPPKQTYKMFDFLKTGSRKGEIKNGKY